MKKNLITAIIILFTQFCLAQDFWMQLDVPENFVGRSMDANSLGWLFVGTNDGIYRSTENGFNLSKIGLENVVLGLTIDIQDHIFAGSGPIYLSSDNGELWNEITTPSDVNVIYAKEGIILYGFWGGIYKSTNNGDTWAQTLELGHPREVASIIEAADGTMYAGISSWSVPGGGVYRSMDNGDSWEYVGLWDQYIRALETNTQGTLFAGSIGGSGVGIYSSDDNGETWAGLKNDVFVTSIVITHEDVIYIGCSNEHGTQGGVFRSFDNGETWEMINTGLIGWENQNVYGLTLSPDGYLYAYGRHLHRSVEPVFSSNLIHQPNDFQTAIYPNPFTSNLNISLSHNYIDSKNTIVSIYDVLGNIVFKQRLLRYSNHFTINTEFLKQGAYFLSIDANGKRYSEPIIKTQ